MHRRRRYAKLVPAAARMEVAKVLRPQHDNTRVEARNSPEPAVEPPGIAAGIRGRCRIGSVGRRRGHDNVLDHRRRWDGSVIYRRWRLTAGQLGVALELADALREGLYFCLTRS